MLTFATALEGERKVVTVLFADVVGFSGIAKRIGPEAAHAFMEGCFKAILPCVHRYGGTVNQFTGDGIMALFGAPVAHEDHAARALKAALAIREALVGYILETHRNWQVRCEMRMGVNSGTVVVGRIGDNFRMDYTAVGDTTNLAARLQQAAPAGAIWAGELTQRLAGEQFEWESLTLENVRGQDRAVSAFALVGRRAAAPGASDEAVERPLTRFVGRDAELGELQAAWDESEQGSGRVVSVVGEAGLGKTRLIREFKRTVLAEGRGNIFQGSCFDNGNTSSYLPFRDLLKSLFQLHAADSESEAVARIANGVNDLGLDRRVTAAVLNLLSYPVQDETFQSLPANLVRERTVMALRDLMAAVAARRPLALILEDLHWIDEATAEVVSALVDDAPRLRLLLVLVFRPPKKDQERDAPRRQQMELWSARSHHSLIALNDLSNADRVDMLRAVLNRPHARWVPLARISAEQSSELVRGLLRVDAIPADLERLVRSRSDGNPLFIEQLVLSLIDSRALVEQDGVWALSGSPETRQIPETLDGLLQSRVDRLTADLKEVVRMAAVIGRVFEPAILAAAAGLGAGVDAALAELERYELVFRQDAPDVTYSFSHVLLQETVYKSILETRRQRMHQLVARSIESLQPDRLQEHCEILAYHYERSPDLEKAVTYLGQANQKAIRLSAMTDAQAYFERASRLLNVLPPGSENERRRVELVLQQVFVALALLKYREYFDLLQQIAEQAERLRDGQMLGAFYARVGWCQWAFGQFAAGIETLDRAARYCEASGNDQDLGFALMTRAWCELARGEFGAALSSCTRALEALERKFDLQAYVRTRSAAVVAHTSLGEWGAAMIEGKQAVEMGERYGDVGMISFAAMVAAWPPTFKGDLDEALRLADLAVKVAVAPADKFFAEGSRGLVLAKLGRTSEALEDLGKVVGAIRANPFPECERYALFYCEALWRAGDLPGARCAISECLAVVEPCGMRFFAACARRLLGEVELADGNFSLAARYLSDVMTAFASIGAENELALATVAYAETLSRMGDDRAAHDQAAAALDHFERIGNLHDAERARRMLGGLGSAA